MFKNRIENIQGLINKDDLLTYIEANQDKYGLACVSVAINVMEYLDDFKGEFNIGYQPDLTTPHGIISKCDDQGGITGFMAGSARNMVAKCHKLGWKFYIADILNKYNCEDERTIDNCIRNVTKENLANHKEAREYITALVKRFKEK